MPASLASPGTGATAMQEVSQQQTKSKKKKKNPSKGFPLGCWELFKGVTPESCIGFLMHSQARDGGDPMTESRLSL